MTLATLQSSTHSILPVLPRFVRSWHWPRTLHWFGDIKGHGTGRLFSTLDRDMLCFMFPAFHEFYQYPGVFIVS